MVSLLQSRAAVGLHNIYFKAKEYSSRVKGNFWSMLLLMFYLEATDVFSNLKNSNADVAISYYAMFWFTQMCVSFLHFFFDSTG